MKSIVIAPGMNSVQIRKAAEAAFLSGFVSECAEFPVCKISDIVDIPLVKMPVVESTGIRGAERYPGGCFPYLDEKDRNGLETIFSPCGAFFTDRDEDGFSDDIIGRVRIPENCDVWTLSAICDILLRMGMETTAFTAIPIADETVCTPEIRFTGQGVPAIRITQEGLFPVVNIDGFGKALSDAVSRFCTVFPLFDSVQEFSVYLTELERICRGEAGASVYQARNAGLPIWQCKSAFSSEIDELLQMFRSSVIPELCPELPCTITAALCKNKAARIRVQEKMMDLLRQNGISSVSIQVICAHKPGYSYIEEYILPSLVHRHVTSVVIGVKPFGTYSTLKDRDTDSATPSYHNIAGPGRDAWLDLPTRCLQELYPVSDLIAQTLHIAESAVTITMQPEQQDTYTVTVYDGDDVLLRDSLDVPYAERSYLNAFPDLGLVHPNTGFIRARQMGKPVIEKTVTTDVERIWTYWQDVILPGVTEQLDLDGRHPFFQKLHLEIGVDLPEHKTGIREELISPGDALEEDLYFSGLDYFKNLGVQKTGSMFDTPGMILPDITIQEDVPYIKAVLNGINEKKTDETPIKARIEKICFFDGPPVPVIRVSGELPSDKDIALLPAVNGYGSVCLLNDRSTRSIHCMPVQKKAEFDHETTVPTDHVIGNTECRMLSEQFGQVRGVRLFQTARSYSGREQSALWLCPEHKGYLSLTKYLTKRVSVLINARHHANEVSSTNAAFMLLKRLLTDAALTDVPSHVNLVIVPIDNPDGTAVMEDAEKKHPYWKHHLARFDALGKEFFSDTFGDGNTLHTEALGHRRLFCRFKPDVVIDNHGVPSHEWDQPFSGYTSPSYRGFWLPRSLLYNYFWQPQEDQYEPNNALARALEDAIADAIAKDDAVRSLNRKWGERFEKYAHAHMPKMFPAPYYRGMISYRIPFACGPDAKYPAVRYPWITAVSYTSEIADETAQGDYLALCARTHVLHDLAMINTLCSCKSEYDIQWDLERGKCAFRRLRPVHL